jgi:cytochrome c-type biogenesis protein CcmH
MRALLFSGLLLAGMVHAAIDPLEFDNDAQRDRYRHFIEDMRCPKCQNQNLAGSDAPIAADLRKQLHRLLLEGKSDREITDFMVARYGEFILYEPPFDRKTAALWLAPIAFGAVGIVALIVIARRRAAAAGPAALSADEQAQLQALLRETQDEPANTGDRRA